MKALSLLALAIFITLLSGCTDSLMQATPQLPTPTLVEPALRASTATEQPAPALSPSAQAFRITDEPPMPGVPNAPGITAVPSLLPGTAEPTPTTVTGELIIPSPTIASAEAPTATLAAQLQGTVLTGVPPTLTPDATGMAPFSGIDGVRVIRLHGLPGDYWAAYSTGSRNTVNDQRPQRHFVTVYEHVHPNGTWREAGRVELDSPDFLSEGGVSQVQIEPSHIWLAVESGAGAHGGCYDVLSFDGHALNSEVSHCASSPGAGHLEDVNGDGQSEVVLNNSDNYVLCYACGVRLMRARVLHWNGAHLVETAVEHLPVSAPGELRELNDRAVDLFRHELMKDAVAAIEDAAVRDPSDQTVAWNRAIIRLTAKARAEHTKESGYPLLAHLFCGDYASALKIVRAYSVPEIFAEDSPLLAGTPAESWRPELVQWITSTTTLAIEERPDLSGAYFLRGWAAHLADPTNPAAERDIDRASTLNPADTLFAESVAYLRRVSGRTAPAP
jgi:hypothetical protein